MLNESRGKLNFLPNSKEKEKLYTTYETQRNMNDFLGTVDVEKKEIVDDITEENIRI